MGDPWRREEIKGLGLPEQVQRLRRELLAEKRRISLEQAQLITASYRLHPHALRIIQRAEALRHALRHLTLRPRSGERLVGNRTPTARAGVVFPEAAVAWIDREIEDLAHRPQDPFLVSADDVRIFREEILPFWRGRTLEDRVYAGLDDQIRGAHRVFKLNQRDHAQGHIIPHLGDWLGLGPAGLQARAAAGTSDLHRAAAIALDGARIFLRRWAAAAEGDAAGVCAALVERPAATFHEAVQSIWMLMVLLHAESNASSFSFGRLDQVLLAYLEADLTAGRLDLAGALELVAGLLVKCNEIVHLRNRESAGYFAGFPIGFNICIGGRLPGGTDGTNCLSFLFLRAQELLVLPQPNLSLRVHDGSPQVLLETAARVIGRGSGMPQVFNDNSIVPALVGRGIATTEAEDYGVVGCVELSPQGNTLGWSDAALFNLVKALELALNDGVCLLDGRRTGPSTGDLAGYCDLAAVEHGLEIQIAHFLPLLLRGCAAVEAAHAEVMPSPLLSCVVRDCLDRGVDVTAGGARHSLSGIQAIQVANLADSLAALETCVFREHRIAAADLLQCLRTDFAGRKDVRCMLLGTAPKYGNDVAWVDELGGRWVRRFAEDLRGFRNHRGGVYHAGLYTVSAHLPMGANVGATPDGRHAGTALADGGVSPAQGRDRRGPTAILRSVARVGFGHASNGALLNMKFLPELFRGDLGIGRFVDLLRGFVRLGIHHVQFNARGPAPCPAGS